MCIVYHNTVVFLQFECVSKQKSSLILLVLLMSLFVYIFLIIQLETMALLAGTLGLFVILAATIYATRSIKKWYEGKSSIN
ncbi:MAG: inner membrane CreD family protein [Saprospiraceae bacterium]|nr:inner membrane CreD family protein [Saprospiraceae bacterium]